MTTSERSSSAPPPSPGGRGVNIKIMIIDDEVGALTLAAYNLRKLGYNNLTEVPSGGDALQQLNNEPVDLIISDWHMPSMDGLQLFETLRNNPRLKNIPFILLTSSTEKPKVIEALRAGITHFVVKPFSLPVMRAKIHEVIKPKA